MASSSRETTSIDSQPNGRMFLTAAEVGHELGVRKSRVYELAASGMLPVIRLGRRMLFPRRGLEELADAAIERSRARMLSDPTRHIS